MNEQKLEQSVKKGEGKRLKAYQDSKGIWTIGYGTNLQELIIDDAQANLWLQVGLYNALQEAKKFTAWKYLDTDARQNMFIEMVYNMGAGRVTGFHDMLGAICVKDWEAAAAAALDSKWHKVDVGKRAKILAEMLRTGKFPI